MKKIGIITIESPNYGNRLQNYALQEVLTKFGFDVYTFHRHKRERSLKRSILSIVQRCLKTKSWRFNTFDKKIRFAEETLETKQFPENINKRYDFFIAGSDQIWNPHYEYYGREVDFLTFARPEQKISYAASIGVDKIPNDRIDDYKRYLNDFDRISVREIESVTIVEELTGKKPLVVLDPTFLLELEQWKMCEKKERHIPKSPYCLVYALGEKNDRFKRKIEELQHQYVIFDCTKVLKWGAQCPIGPSEFLYAIDHADIVLTDSFHATVFSILFGKYVITYKRIGLDMSSRIVSLASMINCSDNIDDDGTFEIDASKLQEKINITLDIKRKESLRFLENALKK